MNKEHKRNSENPIIGITLGDINGIGPEVIIKALADPRILDFVTPVIYGSTKVLSYYRKNYKIDEFNYSQVKHPDQVVAKKINVINCWADTIELKPGETNEEGGRCAFMALKEATEHLKQGLIDALVTGPIDKSNIQSEEFNFPGHTEYFTSVFETADSLMLMASEDMRIGTVTGHIPISKVSESITADKITSKLNILNKSLKKDFGINKPKIAVLGLNPHAGDDGLLGSEENEIILPLLNEEKKKGKLVFGPYPSDGFFSTGQYRKFDGVLAMYHDQALIPFKMMSFENGVNFTAGLPVIRTSPDHGTAMNIAGKNLANEGSMRAAIYMASDIVKKLQETVD